VPFSANDTLIYIVGFDPTLDKRREKKSESQIRLFKESSDSCLCQVCYHRSIVTSTADENRKGPLMMMIMMMRMMMRMMMMMMVPL
jgi:hypothetical protein